MRRRGGGEALNLHLGNCGQVHKLNREEVQFKNHQSILVALLVQSDFLDKSDNLIFEILLEPPSIKI